MPSDSAWHQLATAAWEVRAHAHVHGKTQVGAAVLSAQGAVYTGCNVEHRFRSHDVHAEVNALTAMVSAGHAQAVAVLVASSRDRFTPCGGCLDWVFELGGAGCLVAFQREREGPITVFRADELMPHYPH